MRSLVGALEQGNIRTFGINLGALKVGFASVQAGFGGLQLRRGTVHLGRDLFVIELGQHLALFHSVAAST